MTVRLLVTARDAGATFNLIEIVKAARQDARFSVAVIAQHPAFDYLLQAGVEVTPIDLPAARSPGDEAGRALLARARALLEDRRPDAVLAGLSTPLDGGIDEAVLAAAEVPTFVMQDFWGEVNAFFGKAAGCYLGLDDEAVRLTRRRHGVEGVAIGSPRHAAYAALDPVRLRDRSRAELQIPPSAVVHGIFGQGLHHIEGYRRTVRGWAEVVRAMAGAVLALYRPHPREKPADVADTLDIFRAAGLECRLSRQSRVEEALVACDVVASAFSLCNYDSVYLNRFASAPLITPVSLMFDPEVRAYCRENVHLDEFPYLREGLALAVWKAEDLAPVLTAAAAHATQVRVWEAARTMPDPRGAAGQALETIHARVGPR